MWNFVIFFIEARLQVKDFRLNQKNLFKPVSKGNTYFCLYEYEGVLIFSPPWIFLLEEVSQMVWLTGLIFLTLWGLKYSTHLAMCALEDSFILSVNIYCVPTSSHLLA